MKGKNELLVNEATMIEIVQQWVDKSFCANLTNVEVTSVVRQDFMFKISLESENVE